MERRALSPQCCEQSCQSVFRLEGVGPNELPGFPNNGNIKTDTQADGGTEPKKRYRITGTVFLLFVQLFVLNEAGFIYLFICLSIDCVLITGL